MRAEMTSCEMAQVGIERIMQALKEKCENSFGGSIEIWKLLVCFLRCAVHYGKYLDAFDPKGRAVIELDRITYTENKEDLTLTEEEKGKDETVKKQELEFLNTLGTRQNMIKYNDAIA